MEASIDQPCKLAPEFNNRIYSSLLKQKNIKTLIANRQAPQASDQFNSIKPKPTQKDSISTSRTLKHHRKVKTHLSTYKTQIMIHNSQSNGLIQLTKLPKHEKTNQECVLLKNSDKSKIVYWNRSLTLQGNQRYLILSADLILNQDQFWDKITQDNGNLIPNNASNMTNITNEPNFLSYRNRNNTTGNLQQKLVSSSNLNNNPHNKKNPFFNLGKLNSVLKEWRKLHSRTDQNNRKLVILWMIRKQKTYHYINEFVQSFDLPLHAVIYVKRKRQNPFFDIGIIVKEIHQKFFQSVINHSTKTQDTSKTTKVIERNTLLNSKEKSKQIKFFKKPQLSQQPSIKLIKNVRQIKIKAIKSVKETDQLQNNQNCSNSLNIVNRLDAQILTAYNTKYDQKIKIINKYSIPLPSRTKENILKIQQTQKYKQQTDKTNQSFEGSSQQIPSKDLTKKYYQPQILIFQGIKCNPKDQTNLKTYEGKIPLLLSYYNQRFNTIVERFRQKNIQIQNDKSQASKVFYCKYDYIKDDIWENINIWIKEQLRQRLEQVRFNKAASINQYVQQTIQQKMQQFRSQQSKKQKNSQLLTEEGEDTQLSEEQEEAINVKTEKKLQEIKKQLINHTISLKGRNYTFENGQSIYYFVGDVFKRNYNLFYEQYYQLFSKQITQQTKIKTNQSGEPKKQVLTQKDIQKLTAVTDSSSFKVCEIEFFEFISK